ncbi:MAG: ABC transporter permease subunit, partial [Candidatus Omnitrophica bacterium]|nr:ABC transporter permease subunit [Candidatus Omnitrophota bacterium]
MIKSIVLARKDVSSNFYSWLGILIFSVFFLAAGILFALVVVKYVGISMEAARNGYQNVEGLIMTHFIFGSLFADLGLVVLCLVPLVSMRAFSEERKQQTMELLFTYPLSDFDIVVGKFLSLIWFFALLIFPTLGYLYLFQWLGGSFEWGPVLAGYLGLLLLGAAFLSLGLFISSLTANQVISALLTFGLLVLLWSLEGLMGLANDPWARWLQQISPLTHFR